MARKKMGAKKETAFVPFKSEKYRDPDKKSQGGKKAVDGGGTLLKSEEGIARGTRTGAMKKRMPPAQVVEEGKKQMKGKAMGAAALKPGRKATISKGKFPKGKAKKR